MAKGKRTSSRAKSPARVTCSCLVLCDEVVQTHARDKHTLQGIIGAMVAPSIQPIAGPFVAYLRLSNVHSDERVTVALESPSGEKVWEFEAQLLNRNDPLAVHTLIARIGQFRLPASGRHMLVASHDGVPVAQSPIEVRIIELGVE